MNLHRTLFPLVILLSLSGYGSATVAEPLANAHYANPVERYGHFALGKPHEYASLIATTRSGRRLTLQLPDDEVFEDLVPRIVKLAANGPQAILAIVSQRDSGARLVLIQPQETPWRSAHNRLPSACQTAGSTRWPSPISTEAAAQKLPQASILTCLDKNV